MNSKAAVYDEPEIDRTLLKKANKSVTITVTIDKSDNFTWTQSPAGDIWPGDTLKWHVTKPHGRHDKETLKVDLHRITDWVSGGYTKDALDLTEALSKTLTMGTAGANDGPDAPPRYGVGYSRSLGGTALTAALGSPEPSLVIDTSGPPPTPHPCPPPGDHDSSRHERDED